MAKRIIFYSQPACPFHERVKRYLEQKGVAYVEKDITQDGTALEELQKRGVMSTPTFVVDGEVIVGFDRAKLDELLK